MAQAAKVIKFPRPAWPVELPDPAAVRKTRRGLARYQHLLARETELLRELERVRVRLSAVAGDL